MSEPLTLDVTDRIATLPFNRPDKLNALNDETMRALGDAIDDLRKRADIGGVLITRAGRAFGAGGGIPRPPRKDPADADPPPWARQSAFRSPQSLPHPPRAP